MLRIAVWAASVVSFVVTILHFPLSVYSYLPLGIALVLGYFALTVFSTREAGEISYPRHLVGGAAFAYGTAVAAHAYLPSLGMQQMLFTKEFICFALLSLFALAGTELWEHSLRSEDQEIKASDELALTLPLILLGAACLVFAVQNHSMTTRPFFYAVLTGTALLQILNRTHGRFQISTVKVLASMCLLAPGLLFEAYAVSR